MTDHDVLIVGYGPVGQALACLLGEQGHSVAVVERYDALYGLPRAIRLDGEAMRLIQRFGLVDQIRDEIDATESYAWYGADDELILDIPIGPSPSGWHGGYTFYQPALERALDGLARTRAQVSLGWSAQQLVDHGDHVEVTVRRGAGRAGSEWQPTEETRVIRARYVIGTDGANSFVRGACGIDWVNLGFEEPWLVVDVRPHDMSEFAHLRSPVQFCDPKRPRVQVKNGSRHRRWEFMLLDGEPAESFKDEAAVWRILEPYFRPEQGALVRHAVYQFRSLIAERMRDGQVLLAGDAAHLMPPFMGEGMCSGFRDANNLAWRLDLVLRGIAPAQILDDYTSERRFQNEVTVGISIEMGKVSCTLDPVAAAQRDAAFRSGNVPPPPPLPGLGPGLRHRGAADPLAGERAVQGRVRSDRGSGLLDDVVGRGFVLITLSGDPRAQLDRAQLEFLELIGTQIVTLDETVSGAVTDVDGALTDWLTTAGIEAVLCRPDYYAFGGVASSTEIPALVDDLRLQLTSGTQLQDGRRLTADRGSA